MPSKRKTKRGKKSERTEDRSKNETKNSEKTAVYTKKLHDGRLLGLFLPQLLKFNFWLT